MIDFKHKLSPEHIKIACHFDEFANGAAQVTVRLKDGTVFPKVLVSNATAIIAIRDYKELPFQVNDIAEIYQSEEDKLPKDRSGWQFLDKWN